MKIEDYGNKEKRKKAKGGSEKSIWRSSTENVTS